MKKEKSSDLIFDSMNNLAVRELCPVCRALRDLRVTILNSKEIGKNREIYNIKTKSYHCETCNSFIRSEEISKKKIQISKKSGRSKLRNNLREGYKATVKEDKALSKEWDSTVGDGIE